MPSPSIPLGSSHSSSNRRTSTTDKSALLSALAQELKTSKSQADESAKEMIQLESLIEEKHSSFISEQESLSHLRDRNNSQIHSLRRKLASLKQQLVQAQSVREEEAELYLSLLSGSSISKDSTDSTSNPSSSSSSRDHAPPQRFHSTLPAEYGVTLSPSPTTPIENPYSHSPESSESLLRSPAPYPRATSEVRGPVSPQRVVERSEWQDSLLDQEEGRGGKGGWKGILGGLSIKRRSSSKAE